MTYDEGHRGPPSPYIETVASGGWNIEKESIFSLWTGPWLVGADYCQGPRQKVPNK